MKKTSIFILTIAFLFALLVSCDFTAVDDLLNPEPTPTPVDEEHVLWLPAFEPDTKAMIGFPSENVFGAMNGGINNPDPTQEGGFWMQCNVMSTFPVLPGLTATEKVKPKQYFDTLSKNTFKAFGFKIMVKEYQVNEDGFFVRYEIKNHAVPTMLAAFGINGAANADNSVVGQIDYYYCWEDNTFSYRQFVLPYFDDLGFGDNILVYELQNVPVDEANSGFKAGSLFGNGSYFKFIDFMMSDGKNEHGDNDLAYVRISNYDMVMKFEKGTSVSFGTNCRINTSTYEDVVDNPNGVDTTKYPLSALALSTTDLNQILLDGGYGAINNGVYKRPDVTNPATSKVTVDFGKKVIGFFMNNAFSVAAADFTSIDAFNNKKLELTATYANELSERKELLSPIVFDLNKTTGATIMGQAVSFNVSKPENKLINFIFPLGAQTGNSTFSSYNSNFPAKDAAEFETKFATALFDLAQLPESAKTQLFTYYNLSK